jgi:uncharacterized protein YutE (UPF0331/DUF86 family)
MERIRDKLDELGGYLSELEEDLPSSEEEYLENRVKRRACERTFQLACEDLVDVCNLIISEKKFQLPKDTRDSIKRMEEARIIPGVLSSKLQDMIGFRNLLIHKYGKVNDSRAYNYFEHEVADLYEFIRSVESFLRREERG